MIVSDEDVALLVNDVWSSVVGSEVSSMAPEERVAADREALDNHALTGLVHIQGAWSGTVSVGVTGDLACAIAAAMFGMQLDELSTDEIDDAVGEIANMIGGGVKALLPPLGQLSLPAIVRDTDYDLNLPGLQPVKRLWFRDESGRAVVVSVLEEGAVAPVPGEITAEAGLTS